MISTFRPHRFRAFVDYRGDKPLALHPGVPGTVRGARAATPGATA